MNVKFVLFICHFCLFHCYVNLCLFDFSHVTFIIDNSAILKNNYVPKKKFFGMLFSTILSIKRKLNVCNKKIRQNLVFAKYSPTYKLFQKTKSGFESGLLKLQLFPLLTDLVALLVFKVLPLNIRKKPVFQIFENWYVKWNLPLFYFLISHPVQTVLN